MVSQCRVLGEGGEEEKKGVVQGVDPHGFFLSLSLGVVFFFRRTRSWCREGAPETTTENNLSVVKSSAEEMTGVEDDASLLLATKTAATLEEASLLLSVSEKPGKKRWRDDRVSFVESWSRQRNELEAEIGAIPDHLVEMEAQKFVEAHPDKRERYGLLLENYDLRADWSNVVGRDPSGKPEEVTHVQLLTMFTEEMKYLQTGRSDLRFERFHKTS